MADVVFAAIVAGFSLTAWGLVALCDRLMDRNR
jgi:hypothetical protein